MSAGSAGRPAVVPASAATTKACCASAYATDAVALLLGASYHPGGLVLTRRLARLAGVRAGRRVLDVASGPGSTALLLATEFGAQVDGVDLGVASVRRAQSYAEAAGVAGVRFHVGDAERLPFPDSTFDVVVCECAFCTFPDKPTAAAEIARVLRPGGVLGLTDVTMSAAGLPAELAGLAGWVACLADARPLAGYASLLTDAGLTVTVTERHHDALADMVDQIQARLTGLRLLRPAVPALSTVDVDAGLRLAGQARRAVEDGTAGYGLLIAGKP